jgi:hypothetical protein
LSGDEGGAEQRHCHHQDDDDAEKRIRSHCYCFCEEEKKKGRERERKKKCEINHFDRNHRLNQNVDGEKKSMGQKAVFVFKN